MATTNPYIASSNTSTAARYCAQGQTLEAACRICVDRAGETAERFDKFECDHAAEEVIEAAEDQAVDAMRAFIAHCQTCSVCVHNRANA